MDFDLPGADNDRLRRLEPEINAVIRKGLEVRAVYVPTSSESPRFMLARWAAGPRRKPDVVDTR